MPGAASDRNTLTQLYHRHGGAVFRRCLKMLRDEERAIDATQDVFEKASRTLPAFDSDEQALRWLYRVATHHCLDLIDESARRTFKETERASWSVVVRGQDERASDLQLAYHVLAHYDRLTQFIAFGSLVDGATYAELAAMLEVSTKTIQRKLDHFMNTARLHAERTGS